jgi:hypothetical protein
MIGQRLSQWLSYGNTSWMHSWTAADAFPSFLVLAIRCAHTNLWSNPDWDHSLCCGIALPLASVQVWATATSGTAHRKGMDIIFRGRDHRFQDVEHHLDADHG